MHEGSFVHGPRDAPTSKTVLGIAFAVYVALTIWTTAHHEVWSDEGDAWLLVRDAPFADLIASASNGGVPLLFHLTVLPFARPGLPFASMQLLNLLYVWGAVLLLFRSRAFVTPVKVLFAFSYFAAFEFAVIPRPYGLQMLLMFAMAGMWPQRDRHPVRFGVIVALLANTSSHGLIIAATAGALLLWERGRSGRLRAGAIAGGTVVMLIGGLLSLFQLWPREGRQVVYSRVSVDTLWFSLSSMFFPDSRPESYVLPAILIVGLIVFGISRQVLPVLFLLISGTALLGVYVFIWMGGVRHAGVLLLVVVTAIWIADAYGPYRRERLLMAALAVPLAWSIVPTWQSSLAETREAFSGSREVAAFLSASGVAGDAVLVSHGMFWTSPLVYLPGARICYPASGDCGTYYRWDRSEYERSRMPIAQVLDKARSQYEGRRWVFLTHRPLPATLAGSYRLLFETSVPIWRARGERYYVYEPSG